MKRAVLLTHTVFHYRKEFHDSVRKILSRSDVEYSVIYGQPDKKEALKADTVDLNFGKKINNIYFRMTEGRVPLILQPVIPELARHDLVIIIQENRLLINYLLQILPKRIRPRIALFGHGRNFQSRKPDGVAEKWKRFWATKCDWWFGYTDETRRHIESLGFPSEKITVFNNAVDTSALRDLAESLRDDEVAAALATLGVKGENVAIFVGGLYPDKRLDFLIKAIDCVRERIPDFELIMVGGGVDMPHLVELAANRPWIFVAGPRFGREKAALMRGAKLFLMPGLVGLAVLDAAAMGLPVVTTAWPWHSPEIAYLHDGINGVIVSDWRSLDAYARAVTELMLDDAYRVNLANASLAMAQEYTITAMAERFAAGVIKALT